MEKNTPFHVAKTLLLRLLGIDKCRNLHEREQLLLSHITTDHQLDLLPLLNDLLVLKVRTYSMLALVHMYTSAVVSDGRVQGGLSLSSACMPFKLELTVQSFVLPCFSLSTSVCSSPRRTLPLS